MQHNQRQFIEEQMTLFSQNSLDFNDLCESIRKNLKEITDPNALQMLVSVIFPDASLAKLENDIRSKTPLQVHQTIDNEIDVRNENNDYIHISNNSTRRVIIREGNQIQLFEY